MIYAALFIGSAIFFSAPDIGDFSFDAPVRLFTEDGAIDTADGTAHSGPQMMDINGDGLKDLLVGDFAGNIRVFLNKGSASKPVWGKQTYLEAEGTRIKIHNW